MYFHKSYQKFSRQVILNADVFKTKKDYRVAYNRSYFEQKWKTYNQYFCLACNVPLPVGRHVKTNRPRCCSAECRRKNILINTINLKKRKPDYAKKYYQSFLRRKMFTHCVICHNEIGPDKRGNVNVCSKICWRLRKRERDRISQKRPEVFKKRQEYKKLHPCLPKPMKIKNCIVCNEKFSTHRDKFCSKHCRYIHNYPKRKQYYERRKLLITKIPIDLFCKDCGVYIMTKVLTGCPIKLCHNCRLEKRRENSRKNRNKRKAFLRAAFELNIIKSPGRKRNVGTYSALSQLGLGLSQ